MEIDLQARFNLAILQKIDGQDGRRPHRVPAAGVRMPVPRWQVERENVGVDVDLHGKTKRPTLNAQRSTSKSEWLDRLRLRDFPAAFLASATRIIAPEIEHRLAEMLDNIAAVEIDVFDQRAAIIAIKDDVLVLPGRAPPLHHNPNCIWWPDRRVRDFGRNKKSFPFAHEIIHDAIAFPDAHLDVAFELIKILFRVDEMKIVPRIRTFNHHHEEIAAIIQVAVAHRRLEFVAILLNPIHQVNCGLDHACPFFCR